MTPIASAGGRQSAIEYLRQVVTIDPLYRPGQFFLAFALLADGHAAEAASRFAALTDPVNQQAEDILRLVKREWIRTGVRWAKAVRWVGPVRRFLEPWVILQREISTLVVGGTLYREAVHWEDFGERLRKRDEAKGSWKHLHESMFELYVDGFIEEWGIKRYVQIAAGMVKDEKSAQEAREALDWALDKMAIADLDSELRSLEMQLHIRKANRLMKELEGDGAADSDQEDAAVIEGLLKKRLGPLLRSGIEGLAAPWKDRKWDECVERLRDLRNYTRAPSDSEAAPLLLRALKLPKRTRWFIRFFLPAYRLLDQWAGVFRHALFLESEYYFALANYRTFDRAGMMAARERAFTLHDRLLEGPAPSDMEAGRLPELRLLARCLEADAAVRVALSKEPDPDNKAFMTRLRLDDLRAPLRTELRRRVRGKLDPPTHAVALTTLGLLDRYERERAGSAEGIDDTAAELEHFLSALDLERSPDRCFYVAETLLRRGQSLLGK